MMLYETKTNHIYAQLYIFYLSIGNNAFKSPEDFKVSLPLRTNYLYGRIKKSLPEMYAFTVCMWLKSSASPGIGTPFSYGVPGQANEIVLIEWGNNPIELLVNDKVSLQIEAKFTLPYIFHTRLSLELCIHLAVLDFKLYFWIISIKRFF